MNQEKIVAAIDIGTTKIVAMVGKKNKQGQLEILGVGKANSTGVKRGVVLNIEQTSNAIQLAAKEAQEKSGISFKQVFVGIAGQHIKSIKNRAYKYITSSDNEITQADVDDLTQDMYKIPLEAGDEIIHVIPQTYVVDNEAGVKNPIGMFGKRLEANFHIVIGKAASAKNIKRCVERAGLNVISLMLEPIASASAVLADDEKEAGVVLIDIGGGTTDLAVYLDGAIRHTAVIPYGGNVITTDIKEGCAILQRHAETLKIKYGSALPEMASENKVVTIPGITGREPKEISFKSLAYIIQARAAEIIEAIMYEIENSGIIHKLSAGIVLTGGGALLKHLPQFVKLHAGLDVRIGFPNKLLAGRVDEEMNQPIYSTGIGLLLKGLEHMEDLQTTLDEKKKQETTSEQEEEEEEEKTEKSKKNRGRFIKKLENLFDIFDDKDTKM
ncbi:MAG: cell division protein FtsA [Bacteroidia bacterium]|nr:MAG: cell division protein FtsA [Bacteroidia bacterium]PIE86408.1 MAG: cell division protein FtsA [Bacteroidia bacterium]